MLRSDVGTTGHSGPFHDRAAKRDGRLRPGNRKPKPDAQQQEANPGRPEQKHASVISQFTGNVDRKKLSQRLVDVSDCAGYRDYAAIVSSEEFPQYVPRESPTWTWFLSLPPTVFFIIVIEEEWESGM
jgi:hypothetical protein